MKPRTHRVLIRIAIIVFTAIAFTPLSNRWIRRFISKAIFRTYAITEA